MRMLLSVNTKSRIEKRSLGDQRGKSEDKINFPGQHRQFNDGSTFSKTTHDRPSFPGRVLTLSNFKNSGFSHRENELSVFVMSQHYITKDRSHLV